MRANRGFTLIELMVVVAIVAVVGGLVVLQGRSARQNATIAQGAYALALRVSGLKARALAEGREHVLVIADASDAAACKTKETACGRILVLRNPDPSFSTSFQSSYDPEPPVTAAEMADDGGEQFLPRNTQLDLASTWRAPVPFSSVTAFDSNITFTCAGGRRCFAIRFLPDGDVRPVIKVGAATPAGFAFVLRPVDSPSRAEDRRAIFVSFPAGIVKTAAF